MNQEEVFLHEEGRFVSNARVIVGRATYATANIASVATRIQRPNIGLPLLIILVGCVSFLRALSMAFVEENHALQGSGNYLGLGIGLLIIGIVWLMQLKPTYFLILSTASGENKALQSKREELIESLVVAVNNAMVWRG